MEVLVHDGGVHAAEGRGRVRAVVLDTPAGRQRIVCDTLALSLGWATRDALLRMGTEQEVVGAGEDVAPGCTVEEAGAGGRPAASGRRGSPADVPAAPRRPA